MKSLSEIQREVDEFHTAYAALLVNPLFLLIQQSLLEYQRMMEQANVSPNTPAETMHVNQGRHAMAGVAYMMPSQLYQSESSRLKLAVDAAIRRESGDGRSGGTDTARSGIQRVGNPRGAPADPD